MKQSIKWFAENHIAANLFMLTIFIFGFITLPDIRQELLPNVSLERISITTSLDGASVETVEGSVCKPIENQIFDIEGTVDLTSIAHEGLCSTTIDVADGYSTKDILSIIKSRLENYDGLPSDAKTPDINELIVRNRVIKLILSGTADYPTLSKMARTIRKEILENKDISIIDLEDIKDSEIQIYIPAHNLEKYQISFAQISQVIRQQSNQIPGGMLKTNDGDVLITTDGKKVTADGYRNIIISSNADGAEVTLGDIAEVTDNRNSYMTQASFDQRASVSMDIFRVGDQNIVTIAETIQRYIDKKELPDNMQLYVWQDESKNFKSRIDLLLSNALSGLILVFIILLLFLNLRLSLWVTLGIPFSFFGGLVLMPTFDISINIISLFAFILVLGIVVDDAVIVAEAVHSQNQIGNYGTEGALAGIFEVYQPVIFSVLTTVVAFIPLIFLPGPEGKLMQAIPIIVISILIFSLLESLYILPAHLSGKKKVIEKNKPMKNNLLKNIQNGVDKKLELFNLKLYQPLLVNALKNKGLVILAFTLLFVTFMVMLSTGWMRLALGVEIDAEIVNASVEFPEGASRKKTEAAVDKMLAAAHILSLELDGQSSSAADHAPVIMHVYSVIGPKLKISNQNIKQNLDHTAQVILELSDSQHRKISGQQILNRWRSLIGEIDDATKLTFSSSLTPTKPDINIQFSSQDQASLEHAAQQLKAKLATYSGVYDVRDSLNEKKKQAHIILKDNAVALGLTLEQVILQVNKAYQGDIVQTIQTTDDEIDVWLGLPENERQSLWYLENLPVLTDSGQYVNLSTIADIQYKQEPNNITRYDRKRVATVSAYIDTANNSVNNVQQDLKHNYLDNLVLEYPDMAWDTAGKQKSIVEFLDILIKGYIIAIFVMYLMMAILFSSYSQPFLVLLAIPFGILGSLIGHMLLNIELTLWSFIGMVAVSGIVVNDNLVLMDFINEQRKRGVLIFIAVCEAGKKRLRPILLTSITTFAGLAPLIVEPSIQAKFLIPMAVSLAFGVIFATLISLLLVPVSYLALDQWLNVFANLGKTNFKGTASDETVEEAYQRGYEQGSSSKNRSLCPYRDEVLRSSWEAGWHDAKNTTNSMHGEHDK